MKTISVPSPSGTPPKGDVQLFASGATVVGSTHSNGVSDDALRTLSPRPEGAPEGAYAAEGTAVVVAGDGAGDDEGSRRAAEITVAAASQVLRHGFTSTTSTLEEVEALAVDAGEAVNEALKASAAHGLTVESEDSEGEDGATGNNSNVTPLGVMSTMLLACLNTICGFVYAVGDGGAVIRYTDGTMRIFRFRSNGKGGVCYFGYALRKEGRQGWIARHRNEKLLVEGDMEVDPLSAEEGAEGVLIFIPDASMVAGIYVLTDGFEQIGSAAEKLAMPWRDAMTGLTSIAAISAMALPDLFMKLFYGKLGTPGTWARDRRRIPHDDTTVAAVLKMVKGVTPAVTAPVFSWLKDQ